MNGLTQAGTPLNGLRASKDAVELGAGHRQPETWDLGLYEVWMQDAEGTMLKSLVNGEQITPKLRLHVIQALRSGVHTTEPERAGERLDVYRQRACHQSMDLWGSRIRLHGHEWGRGGPA